MPQLLHRCSRCRNQKNLYPKTTRRRRRRRTTTYLPVKGRSYSSNNKNSALCRQRKVPSIWAWEIWAATKLQKPIFTQRVREEESTRTMRTASRGSNRRLRDRKWTVCRVFWRLAGFELLFVSELSQELTCGLAKKAVEITSLCFTLYIHGYTNIQNQVYGDIYIYIYIYI